MEQLMAKMLFVACGLATICDVIVCYFGIAVGLQANSAFARILSLVAALLVLTLLICTQLICSSKSMLYRWIKCFWVVAVFLDLFAVANALYHYVILKEAFANVGLPESGPLTPVSVTSEQKAILIVIGLFIATAPVAVSYLWTNLQEDDDYIDVPPKKTTDAKSGGAIR